MYDDIDPRNLPVGTVVDGYTVTGRLGGGGMGEIYRVQRGAETFALKLQGERLTEAMDPVKREDLEAALAREAAVLLSLQPPQHPRHHRQRPLARPLRLPLPHHRARRGRARSTSGTSSGGPRSGSWWPSSSGWLRRSTTCTGRGCSTGTSRTGNVLVRDDGSPVVIDLGIARSPAAYTLTRVGTVIGTTTHLSPGICRYIVGDKSRAYRFGPQDDLHALGFMLYERLTGTPPFRVRDDVELPEFEYYHQVIEHVPVGAEHPESGGAGGPVGHRDAASRQDARVRVRRSGPGAGRSWKPRWPAAPASWDAPFVPPAAPRAE